MRSLPAVLLLSLLCITSALAQSDEARRISDAIAVLDEIMGADDQSVPRGIVKDAVGVAIFPSLLKGGFIVGGQRGRGILSVRDAKTNEWSAPAFVKMTGGSIGWQIGAQSVDLVLLVMNKQGVDDLLSNKFKLGGNLSVAAGPVGRTGLHVVLGRRSGEQYRFELPEAGLWEFTLACRDEKRSLVPGFVEVRAADAGREVRLVVR